VRCLALPQLVSTLQYIVTCLPKLAALQAAAGWLTVHAFGRGVRAGLSVLEIVVPVYWFSDSLVNQHHNQARPGGSLLPAAPPAAELASGAHAGAGV
jgi:hypothetical protein